MSDSKNSGTLKPKRGFRSYLREKFSRSPLNPPPSLSPSPQPLSRASLSSRNDNDLQAVSQATNFANEPQPTGERSAAVQHLLVPGILNGASAEYHNPRPIRPVASISSYVGKSITPPPTAYGTTASHLVLSSTDVIVESSAPPKPPADHQPWPLSSDPPAAPTTTGAASKITNACWKGLRVSLEGLRGNPHMFPHLSLAAGILLECFDGIETAARNRQDYESLAKDLATLSESLKEHIQSPTPTPMTQCITSVSMEIKNEVKKIKSKMTRGPAGRLFFAKTEEEEALRRYRRIESMFRQLQTNLTASVWSIANEQLVNTRLEVLHPVKEGRYDSNLSSTISRRSCTEGTRTQVLLNLHEWVDDDEMAKVYWMNGMAGTGKTTIAYTFAEGLERRKLLAASFFCTRTIAECKDPSRIIPTVAYQLARYSSPFQTSLYKVLGDDPDAGSKNIRKQFERLIRDPLLKVQDSIPRNLVVVIDALDECDDREGVEMILDMLFRRGTNIPVRFFVTSRPEPEIYAFMMLDMKARTALHLHDIETSLVQADIELYLKEELAFMEPTPDQIGELAQRSGSLFIYAATLVRYIRFGQRFADPRQRLQSVLALTPESTKKHAEIDALYAAILESALEEARMEQNEAEDVKLVLRTVLFSQEPISVETIAILAGINDTQRVIFALQPLRSVLHQSEDTKLVSTLHASFPDFMVNSDRSKSFFCDIVAHSQLLAQRCFLTMKEQLRFNICELESSLIADEKVGDMQERIKQRISPTLAYACRYWGSHLALTSKSDSLLKMLEEFACNRLLFWMEVLSLKWQMTSGIEALWLTKKWLNQAGSTASDSVVLVKDAYNFVSSFNHSRASQSTPHLYISSLPFCPKSSTVYKNYWSRTRGLLELKGSLMEHRGGAELGTWKANWEVWLVAYSPDGTRVAAGYSDHTIRILNAHDGTPLVDPLRGHTNTVYSVAFSPDGQLLASGSKDKHIRIWNAYTGALALDPLEGHSSAVHSLSFSPDSRRIISGSEDQSIRIWGASNGTLLQGPFHTDSDGHFIAISPDCTFIASASPVGNVQLWNSHDGTPAASPFQGHTGKVNSAAFTLDGTRLVTGSEDNTIRVWNISDGSLATSPFKGHTRGVMSVVISPDGMRVVSSSSDYTVRVWKIEDGTLAAGPFYDRRWARSLAYSPDGARVICATGYFKEIRVWSFSDSSASLLVPFQDHIAYLQSVCLAGNNRIISVGSRSSVWTWDLTSGELIPNSVKGKLVGSAIRSPLPGGPSAILQAEDQSFHVVNITDDSRVAGPFHEHEGSPTSFAFSSDNALLAIASKSRYSRHYIRVWDVKKATPVIGPLYGHQSEITSLDISPDHSRIISGSCSRFHPDRTIRVWNMRDTALSPAQSPKSPFLDGTVDSSTPLFEGWQAQEDGWIINSKSELLFWIPPDIAPASLTPHTEFVITKDGILHIPKWEFFIGDQWSRCYIPD